MAAVITFKLNAETGEYEGKVRKLNAEHEQTGRHLERHGDLLSKTEHGLERTLVKAIAIKEAAQEIAKSFKESAEKAAELSKETGAHAIKATTSLAGLGIKGQQAESFLNQIEGAPAAASQEDQVAFLGKLEALNKQRRENFLPGLTFQQTTNAFAAYRAYGDIGLGAGGEDLLQQFDERHGYGINLNVSEAANRIAAGRIGDELPETAQDELEIRAYEAQEKGRLAEETRRKGLSVRAGQASFDAQRVRHPVFSALYGVADAASFGLTGLAGDAAGEANAEMKQKAMGEVLSSLNRQTLKTDSTSAHGEDK